MSFQQSLFQGDLIRMAPIDHEKDAEIESQWTRQAEYQRLLSPNPARPLSPSQVRKQYEALEKTAEEEKNIFHFAVRTRSDDRLVGFTRLFMVEWTHGNGRVMLGIGRPEDRRQGYGSEALALILRFAFSELNLYRLEAIIPEYNQGALHLFKKAGFTEEVRRRKAIQRDGDTWDLLHLGILNEAWSNLK